MKKMVFLGCLFLMLCGLSHAQSTGIKTNLAHWAVGGTLNAGVEFSLNERYTLEIGGGINPFTFHDNKKVKHWIIQPELRHWKEDLFEGHFWGFHLLASEYNVGGIDIPLGRLKKLKEHRYEGYAYGGGFSYGYQWKLSPKWNFELSLGAGYAYLTFDEFKCVKCGEKLRSDDNHYLGMTKAAISLIYMIGND